MSKVLEKVVLAQVFSHLNSQNLISNFQSVYRPGHSTETAHLKVANDLLTAMDTGKISVLTLLDLSAALAAIVHDISRLNFKVLYLGQLFSSYTLNLSHV